MELLSDTIVAIATPLGRSGVGIVRLSGPAAQEIGQRLIGRSRPLAPRHATFARLATPVAPGAFPARSRAGVRDQAIVTAFPAPQSYTGQDVVEISAHGSPVVLRGILQAAIAHGARLAEPGEFTLRAFLNGKLDLVQAEAVADLIEAVTPLQARAAFDQLEGTLTQAIASIESELFDLMARLEASLDFPEEGYHFVDSAAAAGEIRAAEGRIEALLHAAGRGRLIREGAQIALIGPPNVGKSSLFNRLLNANRAIVTPMPGTTRDVLAERADIGGLSVALIDTAGLRESTDLVEAEGVRRARQASGVADVTVLVLDRSRPLTDEDRGLVQSPPARVGLVVANKSDLPSAWSPHLTCDLGALEVSAMSGEGIDALIARMTHAVGGVEDTRDAPLVSNVRHITLLERAQDALARAGGAIGRVPHPIPEEFVLADLQEAAAALQEITGRRTTDEMLQHIFARFCIGK